MNPARDLPIFEDPVMDVQWIAEWINNRVIPISDHSWSEVSAEFADPASYMSVALNASEQLGGYQLTIELGVRFEDQHRASAVLVAGWDRDKDQMLDLRTVLLNGEQTELRFFVRRMVDFIELPRVQLEAGHAIAADALAKTAAE